MTKDEAIRTAGAAQHAAVKALLDYPLDSLEETAATDAAESTGRRRLRWVRPQTRSAPPGTADCYPSAGAQADTPQPAHVMHTARILVADQPDTDPAPTPQPPPDLNQRTQDAADRDWRVHPLNPT